MKLLADARQIGKFDLQVSTLTAHLYNITIRGTEASSQPPLLRIDKLTVGITIQSLLRHKVTLSELSIEHPVAYVQINRDGKSNIPHAAPSDSSSPTSVFDLAARHVLLTGGEINYNDQTEPLDGELYGLRTEIRFEPLATRYRGSISYDKGNLVYADRAPFQHSLDAGSSATPAQFSIESATLKAGSSAISLHADLTNYSNPAVNGSYEVRIHTQDFAAISKPVTPSGDLALSGNIRYQNAPNVPLLKCISIDGQLASDRLEAWSSEGRLDIHKLQGRYQLANGAFQAHDVSFQALGGSVSSDIAIQHLDTTAVAQLRMSVKRISLQATQQAVRGLALQRVNLVSRVDGQLDASWTGSIGNIRAHTDLILRAPANSAQEAANTIPINGAIHASYNGQDTSLSLRQTTLSIHSATVTAQGEVSKHSSLQIQASANDLHQLAIFVSALRGGQAAPIEMTGSASLHAAVQGSIQRPLMTGQFSARNLQVEGSQWNTVAFNFRASSSEFALQNASLINAHQGKAALSVTVGLQDWSYSASSPIAGNLSVQRIAVSDLQHLADLHYPVSGDLSADISFHGSQLNPAGNGTARIENARAYGESFQRLAAKFNADKSSMKSSLDISMPAGAANGNVSYTPRTKAYAVHLNAPSIVLQKLQFVQAKNLGIAGTLTISARGEGGFDNPQLSASVAVPQLQIRDKSISQLKGELLVANQRAEVTLIRTSRKPPSALTLP